MHDRQAELELRATELVEKLRECKEELDSLYAELNIIETQAATCEGIPIWASKMEDTLLDATWELT